MNPEQIWQATLDELQLQMTQAMFGAWLRHSELLELEDGTAIVGVPNERAKDWLENRLLSTIERTLKRLIGRDVAVQFRIVSPSPADVDAGAEEIAPPAFVLPDYDVHEAGWFPVSEYECRFWAPLLGRIAWRVWEIVRETDRRGKRRTKWTPARRWTAPALAAQVPCGRQALMGVERRCEEGDPGAYLVAQEIYWRHQPGAFDRLQEEAVATVERRGQRPHVTYWISVRVKLGLLRPEQVSRLPAWLQMEHDRWLEEHGFDPKEWDVECQD